MSILQKTFDKMLAVSDDYVDLKKNIKNLVDSVNDLAKSILSITQTLQAHHVVLGELLAFQKELVRTLNNEVDLYDPLDDDINLN
jgi:hypothetical protein